MTTTRGKTSGGKAGGRQAHGTQMGTCSMLQKIVWKTNKGKGRRFTTASITIIISDTLRYTLMSKPLAEQKRGGVRMMAGRSTT